MRTTLLVALALALAPAPVHAQSLMDAAAAAQKAKAESSLIWMAPHTTAATVTESGTETPETPAATAYTASVSGVDANTAAATTLMGARLVALAQVVVTGKAASAKYGEACAGKESSAGWLLRGELVTTHNEETPACLAIAADLSRLSGQLRTERSAIAETARTGGIFPGVLRTLFTRHGIPD